MAQIQCSNTQKNTGSLTECKVNLQTLAAVILAPRDATITVADAKVLANWKTNFQAVAADRFYPLPPFFLFEPSKEDPPYETGDRGETVKPRDGYRNGTKAMYKNPSPCFADVLNSLNDQEWGVYEIYPGGGVGYIRGISTDGTNLKPIPYYFDVPDLKYGSGDASETIDVFLHATSDVNLNKTQYIIVGSDTDFNPLTDLKGLTSVTLTETVSATATGITVTANKTCNNKTITGLVLADWELLDSSGVSQTITSVTDNGDGTYTAVWPSVSGAHTFGLKASQSMTTLGYEGDNVISFTI